MKKFCKRWAFGLFLMLAAAAFAACSSDDDPQSEPILFTSAIVGEWIHSELTPTYSLYEQLTISEDGTFSISWIECGRSGESGGTYRVIGNRLTLYYKWGEEAESGDETVYPYTIAMPDEDTLVLIEEDGDTMTYTRH